jgi:hypothetical protein
MGEEITMPLTLFVAFIEDDTCPNCLGFLRGCEICPVCHADLRPVLDRLEECEQRGTLPNEIEAVG